MRAAILTAPFIIFGASLPSGCATSQSAPDPTGRNAESSGEGGLICCALARQDFLASPDQCELSGGFQQPLRNCRSG